MNDTTADDLPPLFVIWESSRQCWWAPGCKGYTPNLIAAGAYTAEELERANIERGVDEVVPLGDAIGQFMNAPRSGRNVLDAWGEDLRLGAESRESRYRSALQHIADGNISPSIDFARRILDGDDINSAVCDLPTSHVGLHRPRDHSRKGGGA